MSFFDDASLVFLPSGQAGKDGKAYSMKPVPEYGSELVTNGDFATDSDWTKGTGWTISGGTANCDGTQSGNTLLYQNIGHSSNTLYRLEFTISNYVSGTIDFALDSPFFGATNTNGTFVFDITPSSGGNFIVRADEDFVGSLDNISVKEITTNGDFTFSRGSNLTATRVDSNGLIEKGRENLLTQSNNFSDSDWTKFGTITLTSGQSGYDGSNDAWLYESETSVHSLLQYVSGSSVYSFSVYAKAGTADGIRLRVDAATDSNIYVDLTDGSIITDDSDIAYKIESVGNGWYRVSITSNVSTLSNVRLNVTDNVGAQTTGNIYIQDAQLEQGLVATEPILSGATTGLAGILEDSPRFDYSGGASCASLLLEPSRTNLITSEYLPLMSKIGSPVFTPNATTSPEGYQNMAEFSSSATSDRYQKNLGVLSGQHTFSAFFKYSGTDKSVYLRMSDTSSRLKVDIASSGVTIDSGGSTNIDDSDVIDYGNGIYRAYMVFTPSTGTTFAQFYPSATDTSGSIYAYGFQMEEGSYPTSYIPNHSGGSVTREADVNTLLNQSGVIGQTAGTILFDAYFDEADKVNFSISDSTSSNYILIDTTSGKQVFARVQQGGSTQATISTSGSFFAEGDRLKCAIAYDDRDMAFYINGTQVGTASPNLIPACDDIRFTRWNGALAYAADQRVNRVVLFDTRISNGILATLTS